MVGLGPTERLEALSARRGASGLEARTTETLERYELFLSQTDASREELLAKFEDDERFAVYLQQEDEVGDSVYELLASLGKRNPKLFRILVV